MHYAIKYIKAFYLYWIMLYIKDFWKREIEELLFMILIDMVSIYTDCMSTKIGNWLQRNRKQNKLSNYTNKWYNYKYSNLEIPWFSPLTFSTWLYILINILILFYVMLYTFFKFFLLAKILISMMLVVTFMPYKYNDIYACDDSFGCHLHL